MRNNYIMSTSSHECMMVEVVVAVIIEHINVQLE